MAGCSHRRGQDAENLATARETHFPALPRVRHVDRGAANHAVGAYSQESVLTDILIGTPLTMCTMSA